MISNDSHLDIRINNLERRVTAIETELGHMGKNIKELVELQRRATTLNELSVSSIIANLFSDVSNAIRENLSHSVEQLGFGKKPEIAFQEVNGKDVLEDPRSIIVRKDLDGNVTISPIAEPTKIMPIDGIENIVSIFKEDTYISKGQEKVFNIVSNIEETEILNKLSGS